ncbi:alpha/beta fold hydrolase [Massilia glaciei]|uniref:Alpha/beta hydrolase n=1 Tax=Massilia glaciei TaxID=1524097 RepID=A0A2U2HLB2_9BURK|nr:alpha/beta fold hydrolase [Massilia glaciei]PWF48311.1 alpha/beta hydrolase [Massilia glaciei]
MVYVYLLLAALAALFVATRLAPELLTRIAMGAERRFGGLSTRTARVGRFDMPYLEGGKGEALMLIHGFAGDKDNFTRIARHLTPHYRVLVPDLPGFGEATRDIDANYFMSDQVGRLHVFLAQMGVSRVHLAGNSMGGFIAAQFAATYPEMVGSVWLIDAAGTEAAHDTPLLRHYEKTGEMPLLVKDEAGFDALMAATMHKVPYFPRFLRRVLARRAIGDFALHTQILQQLTSSTLLEAQYAPQPTPALIVWGAEDRILSPTGADALALLFPNSKVHIIDGLGHLPMLESPKAVVQEYLAFRRTLVAPLPVPA